MTIADAAHITEVPERTIRRWAADGLIAAPRIDHLQRVSLRQVNPHADAWHLRRKLGTRRARVRVDILAYLT
jgi:DNA-binding transcriptional MerR regulator